MIDIWKLPKEERERIQKQLEYLTDDLDNAIEKVMAAQEELNIAIHERESAKTGIALLRSKYQFD